MEHAHWEMLVVVYLYLGGLGAGTFVFSALSGLRKDGRFDSLARTAALIAPFPVMIGAGLLIFDLGSPLRFWRLFSTVELSSPMSVGSWLLILFTGVSLLHMALWLFPEQPGALRPAGLRIPLPAPRTRRTLRNLLAAAGLPLAAGVGIYTGVLLGAVPARPFWNTPMVAQLFLFSALSTAAATLILVSQLRRRNVAPDQAGAERRFLYTADVAIIMLEVFLVVPYILHNALSTASQSQSLALILGGPFTEPFWIGFVLVGLVLPLVTEVLDLLPTLAGRSGGAHWKGLGVISAIGVLVGGFVLRWVFVFAGQMSRFG